MTAPILYSYVEQTTKNLIASVDGPLQPTAIQHFLPGAALTISIKTLDGTQIANSYTSIKAEFKGTSGVQNGGGLPSLHPLFQQSISFDLAKSSTSAVATTTVPKVAGCFCRAHVEVPLPATTKIINRDGHSREAEESGLVVAYVLEIVARKKGLGKPVRCASTFKLSVARYLAHADSSARSIRFSLSVPIGNKEPYGPSVFTAPSLKFAEEAWAALGDWVWRKSTLVDLRPQLGIAFPTVTQAEIAYHFTILPTRIFFRWRVTLTPSENSEFGTLLRYLEPTNVDVFLARKIIPLLSDRQGGGTGIGKAYRTDLRDVPSRKGEPSLVATDEGPCARLEGSFELPPSAIAIVRSCNAEIQHLLIASISWPEYSHPLNVHTELHRSFGTAGPLSNPSPMKKLTQYKSNLSDPPTFTVSLPSK